MRNILFALVLVSVVGPAEAATPYRTDFVTNVLGSVDDPGGVVSQSIKDFASGGWIHSGHWTVPESGVDLNPTHQIGSFQFDDPDLTMSFDMGENHWEFRVTAVTFAYSYWPDSFTESVYEVSGISTVSPIPGATGETITIAWETAGLYADIPAIDSPVPLPGSPWDDGASGNTVLIQGMVGSDSYSIRSLLGSYEDPYIIPEPNTGLLLLVGVVLLTATRTVTS